MHRGELMGEAQVTVSDLHVQSDRIPVAIGDGVVAEGRRKGGLDLTCRGIIDEQASTSFHCLARWMGALSDVLCRRGETSSFELSRRLQGWKRLVYW